MAYRPEPRYAHKEVRQTAEWLKVNGFRFLDVDSDDHPIFVWPASGETVKLPGTPKGHAWLDNVRKQAARIAGLDIANKRDADAIKDRQAAERQSEKERRERERERRNREALRAIANRNREAERQAIAAQILRRRAALADIERLMRQRPSG